MKKQLMMMVFLPSMMAFAVQDGAWTLTLGPACRSRVKSSLSSEASLPDGIPTTSQTTRDGGIAVVQDPDYPEDPSMEKYAATKITSETIVNLDQQEAMFSDVDVNRPLGVKANLGYGFYQDGPLSIGLNLKFAGYWNMRSSATGFAGGGTVTTRESTEYYLYNDGPFPDDDDFSGFFPDVAPYQPYTQTTDGPVETYPASIARVKMRSDLYQIGIGPGVTWHAFDFLEVYGGVELLSNIAHLKVEADRQYWSDTKWMIGFGGEIGAMAYLTENFGLYAEVGYEWVDETTADIGWTRAKIDYSSFVFGAGLAVRF